VAWDRTKAAAGTHRSSEEPIRHTAETREQALSTDIQTFESGATPGEESDKVKSGTFGNGADDIPVNKFDC
jgi:hypothetical protein